MTTRDARPSRANPVSHRLLVVSLGSLRDLVFTSALTPLLRGRYPDAEITLWCRRHLASVGMLVPDVDRVESAEPFWERQTRRATGAIVPFVRSALRLRRHRYDVAIAGGAPWLVAAAIAATGAGRRIGFARDRGARWLTDALPDDRGVRSLPEEMTRLLEPLGIAPPADVRCQLDPQRLAARRERFRVLLGARPVALHPFAGRRDACVPLKQWIRVAVELARRGYEPLWIGRTHELVEVHRAVGSAAWKYVDKLGDGSLADVAAAISLAHLYIGHDSGPLHLAGALGVRTIGVYTPGGPERAFPQGIGEATNLVRSTPDDVTSDDMLDVIDELPIAPPLRLMR